MMALESISSCLKRAETDTLYEFRAPFIYYQYVHSFKVLETIIKVTFTLAWILALSGSELGPRILSFFDKFFAIFSIPFIHLCSEFSEYYWFRYS